MDLQDINKNLEALYLDYYDGLYTEQQLKIMLLRMYKKYDIPISKWSELILDAQWKYASEQDYNDKIKQLKLENREDDEY